MENQVNIGDQNNQQIGQNPLSQPILTPEKPKTNYLMISGVILGCFVIFGFGGYYLGRQSTNSSMYSSNQQSQTVPTAVPEEIVDISPSPPVDSNDIQKSTYSNQYFSFTYPKTWQTDNTIIYEHRSGCDPDTFRCTNEKNIVDIRSNTTQIYQGYTNSEWFNKIASLNSPWETDRDIFTKLTSGQTQEGREYIVFKQSPSANFEGEPLTLINGYILNSGYIYELRLSHFNSDSEGIQLLKLMLQSLKAK